MIATTRACAAALGAAAVALAGTPSCAFDIDVCGSAQCSWPQSEIPVTWEWDDNPDFNDANAGTTTQQEDALQRGASNWNEPTSNLEFNYGGTAGGRIRNNNEHIVIVTNVNCATGCGGGSCCAGGDCGACASVWSDADDDIVDCDVEFFDDVSWFRGSVPGSGSNLDINSGMTEEFGHCAGLDHSQVAGVSEDGVVVTNTTTGRDLFDDDVAAARALYGGCSLHTQETAGIGTNESFDDFGRAVAVARFDGVNVDWVIGAPGEAPGSDPAGGGVFLWWNNGDDGFGFIDQEPIATNEAGDEFGFSLAVGDFNDDGLDDLAVGKPGEAIGAAAGTGAVNVFMGCQSDLDCPSGLTCANTKLCDLFALRQLDSSDVRGDEAAGDDFGRTLAAGDVNGDGMDDLAVGAPGENGDAGTVFLYYACRETADCASGSCPAGENFCDEPDVLTVLGIDEAADEMGRALAIGDFDDDGFADVAVGVPGESALAGADEGVVDIYEGRATGVASTIGPQSVDQDPAGTNEAGDRFGRELAVGDFDGDGVDDLAVGAPQEAPGGDPDSGGAVFILYGNAGTGLSNTAGNVVMLTQEPVGESEGDDDFGIGLAACDVNADGFDDIAVGTPQEERPNAPEGGVVYVYQGASGRSFVNGFWIDQYPGASVDDGDRFGVSIACRGDDSYGGAHLLIGAPREDLDITGIDTGAICEQRF